MVDDEGTLTFDGLPPLREIRWDEWLVALPLPALASLAADGQPPGTVEAYLSDLPGKGHPDPLMIEACRWILDHDAEVERAVVTAILGDIDNLRAANDWLGEELDLWLPADGWDEARARSAVSLTQIVPHAQPGAQPYYGLIFSAGWDEEHGYGLMMMGTDIVRSGGADTAVLEWIAKDHAEAKSVG